MAKVRTACPLDCWDTCAFIATVEDERLKSVAGDRDDPYTAGFVCPKAYYQLERTLAEDRPLHPMRKDGGIWRRVGWNEAFDLLALKITDAIRDYGSSSLFYYHDSGSTGLLKTLGLRLFRTLGATEPLGSLCWSAGTQAQKYDFGHYRANLPEDALSSKLIIIWGRNPSATNIHLVPFLQKARRAGARVILIDVMNSASTPLADEVVRVNPGTDGALALAMANVIFEEGLVDVPFAAAYTYGLNAFREHVRKHTAAWAAPITGLPVADIRRLASDYGRTKPAAILMGYGLQRYFTGGNTVRAIDALGALTGNVGRRGGGVNYANGYISSSIASLVPAEGPETPSRKVPRARMSQIEFLDPPVRVLVTATSNFVNQSPGADHARRAFLSVPFKATLDLRWTETCEYSDLFLPVASPFESEDVFFCSWHPQITLTEKCVEPRGEALPDHVIWSELAKRLGVAGFDRTPEQWIDLALKDSTGGLLTASSLRGRRVRFPGIPTVAWEDCRFRTPSGKFEFYSELALRGTGNAMATYEGPATVQPSGSEFPLRLISPRGLSHLHSQFYDKMLSGDGLPFAYASKETVVASGAVSGGAAILESREGSIKVTLEEDHNVPPDLVVVFEGGSVLSGLGVNALTPEGETDMGHGPLYYDCFVRLLPSG